MRKIVSIYQITRKGCYSFDLMKKIHKNSHINIKDNNLQ